MAWKIKKDNSSGAAMGCDWRFAFEKMKEKRTKNMYERRRMKFDFVICTEYSVPESSCSM
jgi:hypothetical protein